MDITHIIRKTVHTDWAPVLLREAAHHNGSWINDVVSQDIHDYKQLLEVLPPKNLIFNAFTKFDVGDTRVCILGQDPYPTKGHAMGLSFSVPTSVTTMPPSLRNIFKELEHEYGVARTNKDLTDWADQGVLLLNTALTVLEGKAGRHTRVWNKFTRGVIEYMNQYLENIVYILWGNHAKEYADMIDHEKNYVLTHSHPSPLARIPFVGNGHFKLANTYLEEHGMPPVNWIGSKN